MSRLRTSNGSEEGVHRLLRRGANCRAALGTDRTSHPAVSTRASGLRRRRAPLWYPVQRELPP
eukprot:CAMPEP_0194328844 /NCGR_PEP_ID=MMETSP0171-20130528/46169_1 /TAXON_ID=218684 /ORGANISM="Corethron pennatum, Strain L29A3" /LENGTH=62 /DNA_ID=CAMNT_0039089345 /DNA_START=134 /DNA_END=322 /DNA_ORIENTATION=-